MTFRCTLLMALGLSTALTHPALAHETERRTELFKPGVHHAAQELPANEAATLASASGYGDFGFDPGTQVPQARAAFEQGIALLWGFNHAAAVQAFRAAQEADPGCFACHWAEAYALGPNLNDGMHEENVGPAFDAAWTAVDTAVTEKEIALARALVLRYAFEGGDRALMNKAFAEAMGEVAVRFPDDPNIHVFHADALMNMQPWDYWEADGVTPKGNGAEILAALERAIELAPEHPAALHLYIHAVEASADPARAEEAADALRGSVPMAGHLVHMPAHIYNRIGRYEDSIAVNTAAIDADETYLGLAGDGASALYRYGYYPHNVHFLLVGAQMAGLKDEVLSAAEKLAAVTSDEVSRDLAWVQAIDTAPYTAHAQFSAPEVTLALPDPGDAFPFVKGHWHYARGTALALQGDLEGALAEQKAIEAILAEADLSGLEEQYLPAHDVLEIAKHIVEARISQAQEDWPSAEHHLGAAIALEATISYMEPPYWYYPVSQTLGAVRLQAGDFDGAQEAFDAALTSHPGNAWALWGLAEIARRDGAQDAEQKATARFDRAWLGSGAPALNRI
ncbi:tetratricopeptide repeat protein [Alloyangia pacifica]|uniref:Tetratricopeptide repeat-containing protein n=1 Tax=Alloyangia pacifica TaxID=311180 RepID=A0A1I6WN76_9RHOB|nr:tetratricopeptide repeat protein [Alloyangia pacifica]SDI96920.1 Tetratricopeptide repeat-containing protein [Alloyangia pacifica]SFT27468.1 Tetratricopeptide repeat-containing protein [Alloyangia pacifica]